MSVLQPVIALLQFTTIIPLGQTAPFELFAKRCWLYPCAGYITGGVAGVVLFLLPAPPMVSAALGIALVFFITGCNHLDGLLDLGDGLMVHGSRSDRIRALTDRTIGTGGIAMGITVTLLAWSSLSTVPFAWAAIITAEVAGKYTMAIMTIFGRPFHDGLHATLHRQTRPWFILPATLLLIPLFVLPIPVFSLLISVILMLGVPVALIYIASRLFGGVNGDITGAAGEISRAGVLVVIACTASLPEISGFFNNYLISF
ncbi:MAG: adenosylcobinamide-GDP ribazoletransferase [Methanobacteriota archaeon]